MSFTQPNWSLLLAELLEIELPPLILQLWKNGERDTGVS